MLPFLSASAAFTLPNSLRAPSARLAITMFEEAGLKEQYELRPSVTKSRDTSARKGCSVVLTEGTGSFYASRTLIQMLHDFGAHRSITVQGESVADMKKALISRASRYSGLLDILDYSEAEAWVEADAWLAINADEAALPSQIEAARAAGVKRAFVVLTEDGPTPSLSDADGIEALLKSSGLAYTIMRTGALIEEDPEGGGLVLGEVDMPVCGSVSKADVFRFVTESLTLPEAEGRTFSLCPSDTTQASLREMRLCGYERREEVAALLKGVIEEKPETADMSPEEAEVEAQYVLRSEAEIAAERAEELRAAIARAKARGAEVAARVEYEEKEKLKKRSEMAKYYQSPPSGELSDSGDVPDFPPRPPE